MEVNSNLTKTVENKEKHKVLNHINDNAQNKIECEYFNGVEISKLSKRQMKKYKKCLKWQEVKKEKRLKEKNKLKERRKYQKMNNINMGPSRKELKKRPKMKDSPCKISVCIDLSFDHLMIDKVSKILVQVTSTIKLMINKAA